MYVVFWIVGSFILALGAGPALFVASTAGEPDPSDVYVVLGLNDMSSWLSGAGVREIGPVQAPFGRMVIASPQQHNTLIKDGFLVLPASALAEICGITKPGYL